MTMAILKLLNLRMLLSPNLILLLSLLSRSYGKHIHSDTGRMRLEIENLPESQNGAPESSASGFPQQAVSEPPGRGSSPANFSLYLLPYTYPLLNISELQINHPYIEMSWDMFSRSGASTPPRSREDSKSASEANPTRTKGSSKFLKNLLSTKKKSSFFLVSSNVTEGSRFPPNLSKSNKLTDIPSKESFEMAKDSLHIVDEPRNHINKIEPERTSEDAGTTNSQGDVILTAITYRDGRAMFHFLGCMQECHVHVDDSSNGSLPRCVVDVQCCHDHYGRNGSYYLDCVKGLKRANPNSPE